MDTMSIASTIALSGINAASLRLQVSASNVANARSTEASPDSANATALPSAAGALRVNQVALANGGTSATVSALSTDTLSADDLNANARSATAWAFAANPYVALTNEMVQQLVARFDLIANAQVIRADAQTSAAIIDIKV
jgi:flagellar basal-body rod protein FlgC